MSAAEETPEPKQRRQSFQDVQSAMYKDIVALTKAGVFKGHQGARTVLQHYRFNIAFSNNSARGFRRGYVMTSCTQPAVVADSTGLGRTAVNEANKWLHQQYLVTITDNGAVIDPFLFPADQDEQRRKLVAEQPRSAPELRDGPKGHTKLAALKMEPKGGLTTAERTINYRSADDTEELTTAERTHTLQSLRPSYNSACASNEPNRSASSFNAPLEGSEEGREDSGAGVGASAGVVARRSTARSAGNGGSARPAGSRPGFNNSYYVQTKGKLQGNFTRSDKLAERKVPCKVYDGEVLVELTEDQAKALWKIKDHSRRKTYMLGLVTDARVGQDEDDVQDYAGWDDDLVQVAEQFAEEYVRRSGMRSRRTAEQVVASLGAEPKDMLRGMLDIVHNEWESEDEDLADKWLARLETLEDLAPVGDKQRRRAA